MFDTEVCWIVIDARFPLIKFSPLYYTQKLLPPKSYETFESSLALHSLYF